VRQGTDLPGSELCPPEILRDAPYHEIELRVVQAEIHYGNKEQRKFENSSVVTPWIGCHAELNPARVRHHPKKRKKRALRATGQRARTRWASTRREELMDV